MEKIKEAIENHNGKIVSFDIFDTLIFRPELESRDLFFLVEARIKEELGKQFPFSKIRRAAEHSAREKLYAQNPAKEEILLGEIYEELITRYGISTELADHLMNTEQEIEIKYCRPRLSAQEIYKYALSIGKKITLVSDMYLPKETILKQLKNCKYDNFTKFYLSSNYELSKHKGGLWDFAINDLKNSNLIDEPRDILHVGDNKWSDYEVPSRLGINSISIHNPKNLFLSSPAIGKIVSDQIKLLPQEFKFILGFLANHKFDNHLNDDVVPHYKTLFGDTPYELGFQAGGMFILNFALWMYSECKARNYDEIVFLSRDGYTLKNVCDKIFPILGANIKTQYLPISRRAIYATNVQSLVDICTIELKHPVKQGMTPRMLIESRFNFVDFDVIANSLYKHGVNDLDSPIENLQTVVDALTACSTTILEAAETERDKLAKYYSPVLKNKNAVLFDLGYHGSAQRALSELLDRKLPCFYFYGHKGLVDLYREGFIVQCYLSHPEGSYLQKQLVTEIVETFFCSHGPSVTRITQTNGSWEPEYEQTPGWGIVGALKVAQLQEGIFDFIDELIEMLNKDVRHIYVEPSLSYLFLEILIKFGGPSDKMLFSDIEYENAITGERQDLSSARYWRYNKSKSKTKMGKKLLKSFERSPIADLLGKNQMLRKTYNRVFYRKVS